MTKTLLKSLNHKPFQPLPLLESGFAQSVASTAWPFLPLLQISKKHTITLPDSDKLVIIENKPAKWVNGDRIAVLVHGLINSSNMPYMIRIARKLVDEGILVFRVNLRGCGPGFGHAKNIYHAGQSDDTRIVLKWISKKYSRSPITQVGFSLGGNITLKMAGEDGAKTTGNLDSVVAVSPPMDLGATGEKLAKKGSQFFNNFFLFQLRKHVWLHHRKFPDIEKPKLPLMLKLTDFDNLYTAPLSGFKNAKDYHDQSSCGQYVPDIKVPNMILCASDDPIVEIKSYTKIKFPESTELVLTKHGGHVGFIGTGSPNADVQWMDSLVKAWVLKRDQ